MGGVLNTEMQEVYVALACARDVTAYWTKSGECFEYYMVAALDRQMHIAFIS